MTRAVHVVFALFAYGVFVLSLLYLVGFLADLPALPRTIDHPVPALPPALAAGIDLVLIGVFGVQHSVMARQGFKAAWTRLVPRAAERSVYMLFSCAALLLLYAAWQPLPALAWDLRGTPGAPLLWAVFGLGWLVALLSTFLIDHFELFGLAQAWNRLRAMPPRPPRFRQPFLYRLVRHPLYSGFIIAFWASPAMSLGHLLFAAAMTGYILVAIELEERDLTALFGAQYEAYRRRVGKLTPRIR